MYSRLESMTSHTMLWLGGRRSASQGAKSTVGVHTDVIGSE